MSVVAAAGDVVHAACARLRLARVADGATRGAAAGAVTGLVAAAALAFFARPPVLLLAIPVAGALAGALAAARRRTPDEAGALALDRAAATDEAFVSAVTATDAPDWVRDATADRALRACGRADVPRFLPIPMPATAAAAAAATGLLAAILLVPADEVPPPDLGTTGSAIGVAAPPGGAAVTSPQDRVRALADAARQGASAPEPARAAVRSDLAAVGDDDIRALAEALAASGSEAAKRALEALARGDRETATDALRAALGARDAGAQAAAGGGATAGAAGSGAADVPRSSGGGSWPLRYDRAIRRYLEEIR